MELSKYICIPYKLIFESGKFLVFCTFLPLLIYYNLCILLKFIILDFMKSLILKL